MKLTLATEEQKRGLDLATYGAWGMKLTQEGYLERERRLRRHRWSEAELRTWILCGSAGEILSSCETYRMDSLLRTGGAAPQRGSTFAVASVFTEPRLRGHRYASQMMSLLVARLREEPAAHATVLYSDVGAPIYERAGYRVRPAVDLVFDAAEGDPAAAVDALISEGQVAGALAELPLPEDPFVIWPTAAQVDWHVERERIYCAQLGMRRPPAQGARAGRSTAFWAANVKNELLVVLMHAASAPEAEALLLAARRVATLCALDRVRVWELPAPFDWPLASCAGRRVEREGGLPMICPLAPLVSEDTWRTIHRALWV
jgi:hypothetical protein